MPADKIETVHGSVVQRGAHNDRIYVMRLKGTRSEVLTETLEKMALEQGYGKIVAKIPATRWPAFQTAGYTVEALVPGLFNGETDGLFVARYLDTGRRQRSRLQPARFAKQTGTASLPPADPALPIEVCRPSESGAMAAVYRQVFATTAFPIDQPAFLRQQMNGHAVYCCARTPSGIAALAAVEIDATHGCGEMTDFATLPAFRRTGLATGLLTRLEAEAVKRRLQTAYTIARADSRGMNRVFLQNGYRYAGCLIKNTQIAGRIRSMFVWYKHLKSP